MSVINTNVNALNAQNSIYQVNKSQSMAMQQLSTGQRINSAKDDAAGLAVITRMTSDINGFGVAVQNSNQGMNMAQTADGALSNVNNILQSMRQLAVEASNGTMTAANRQSAQAEVAQLQKQIDSIAQTTTSNGIQLLNGTAGNVILQTGVLQGNTMTMSIGSVQTKDIGIGSLASLTSIQSGTTPKAMTAGDLLINGVQVGPSLATSDTVSYASNTASSISKAAAINLVSVQTGVTATVDPTVVEGYGSAMTNAGAGDSGQLIINGISTATIYMGSDVNINRQSTATAINALSSQTGVTAIDTGDAVHGIKLVASDGRNITISGAASSTLTNLDTGLSGTLTAGGSGSTYGGQIELHSTTNSPITIGTTATGALSNSGFSLGTFNPNLAQVVTNQVTAITSAPTTAATGLFDGGTLVLNGVAIGASKATDDTSSDTSAAASLKANSAIAISAAINRTTSLTGVSASAAANTVVGGQFTAGAVGGLVINGITITNAGNLTTNSTKIDVINAINTYSGQTGVVATDNGQGITYTAQDGRNISFSTTLGTENSALGLSSSTLGLSAAPKVYYSKIQLTSANKFTVASGVDGNAGFSILGFQAGTYGGANNGLKINQINVSTQSGAQTAITAIDAAISTVSAIQSNVGAYENRLASTVTNLQSMNTNMSASRSTIQDTDYSTTTTALARNQIISQAATAMLAQANQSGQTVLSLLK